MSLTISFKAKAETIYNMDSTPAYRRVKVPKLGRSHVNIEEWRRSRRYGGFANSDLLGSLLAKVVRQAGIKDYVRLDRMPESVSVVETSFLAVITISLQD